MDHPLDPCDLTIAANHQDSHCYDNDRQWFGPGVFRWWMKAHAESWERLERARTRCLLTAFGRLGSCSHLYHNEVEILNPWSGWGSLGTLTLMFKVTPLRETPTHWLTLFARWYANFRDLRLRYSHFCWKKKMMSSAREGFGFHLHIFIYNFMSMTISVVWVIMHTLINNTLQLKSMQWFSTTILF